MTTATPLPPRERPAGAAGRSPLTLVNLTPHALVFFYCGADGAHGLPELPPSGTVAALRHRRRTIDRLPVVIGANPLTLDLRDTAAEEVVELPGPRDGVVYICEPLVARCARAAGRRDVLTYAGVQRHFSRHGRLAVTGLATG